MPLGPGDPAPPIPTSTDGPRMVVFYKVTCPTCQVAAPAMERLHKGFPDRLVAVVQDPPERAEGFAREFGTSFASVTDDPPYELSDAFSVRTVPTLFVVDAGRVVEAVESWDRDGWNRAAARLGALVGEPAEAVSWDGDGLPPFRPG